MLNGKDNAYITFEFSVRNNSNKAITSYSGSIYFEEPNGKLLDAEPFTDDDGVLANQTTMFKGHMLYNEYLARMVQIRNSDVSAIKVESTLR